MRQTIPKLPHPDTLNSLPKDEAEKLFSQWEKDCEEALQHNRDLFEKDLKKIRLCAFLRGFRISFTPAYAVRDLNDINKHYSWCPSDRWTDNTGKYLCVEVDEKRI